MNTIKLRTGAKIKDYIIINELGSGSFGVVYEAAHANSQEIYAIKCLPREIEKQNPKF